jgi:hypothetical protein
LRATDRSPVRIVSYPIREPSGIREPAVRPTPPSPRRQQVSSPTGVPSLASRFLSGRPVQCDDPELLAATVWELEDRLDSLIGKSRFSELMRTDQAVKEARAQLMESLKRQNQERRQAEVHARTSNSRQEFEEFSKTITLREQQLEMRLKDQLQQLRDKQARESAEHDAQWQVDPKERLFNRSSQKLRMLRLQRHLLLASHKFDEAAQVSGIGDKVVRSETAERHYQMQTDFEASRVLLDRKHADELDTLMQTSELRRGEFRYIKETLSRRFGNRFMVLKVEEQAASDADKLWARTHRNGDGDQLAAVMGGSRKKVLVSKTPNVADFNTLVLPPLEMNSPVRRRNKFGTNKT